MECGDQGVSLDIPFHEVYDATHSPLYQPRYFNLQRVNYDIPPDSCKAGSNGHLKAPKWLLQEEVFVFHAGKCKSRRDGLISHT